MNVEKGARLAEIVDEVLEDMAPVIDMGELIDRTLQIAAEEGLLPQPADGQCDGASQARNGDCG